MGRPVVGAFTAQSEKQSGESSPRSKGGRGANGHTGCLRRDSRHRRAWGYGMGEAIQDSEPDAYEILGTPDIHWRNRCAAERLLARDHQLSRDLRARTLSEIGR